MVGAYAGNRLGAVRDAKGKAVAAVFAELATEQKAEVRVGSSSIARSAFHGIYIIAKRLLCR